MKFILPALLGALAPFALAQDADIPTTAVNAGSFDTLVAALSAADLVDALSAPNGPFTVFAPTDEAFAALPEEFLGCLLDEDNISFLTEILTYHVASGSVLSTDLFDGQSIPTLNGASATVNITEGVVDIIQIDSAVVVTPDIETSNGIIHVINSGR